MENEFKYYEAEIKKLSGHVTIKFYSDGGESRYINLNEESYIQITEALRDAILEGVIKL